MKPALKTPEDTSHPLCELQFSMSSEEGDGPQRKGAMGLCMLIKEGSLGGLCQWSILSKTDYIWETN